MTAEALRKGEAVELFGLVGRPELNGRSGLVAESPAGAGGSRVAVRLMAPTGGAIKLPGALVSIKPSNLKRTPPFPSGPSRTEDTVESALRDSLVDVVGPDVFEKVKEKATCVRCCEPCEGKCRVPHPPHLQVDCGSSFGPGGAVFTFACQACGEDYSLHCDRSGDMSEKTVQDGPEWCYEGEHTLVDLPNSDKRRTRKDLLSLTVGPDLQQQLDSLPVTHPDVKVLVVQSQGLYDDSVQLHLRAALPKLEEVQLIDVAFVEISLTEELTPKVKKLMMQNVPEECEVDVRLPLLENVTLHYYRGNGEAIQRMLDSATQLCTFESYKLWSNDRIAFASNDLTDIKLHRSDSLSIIELWAPRLQNLNVQACYSLENIEILDTHPLASDLPAAFKPTRFQLYTLNASLSPRLKMAMSAHPRVDYAGDDDSDDDDFGGNPMEALFAQMHQGGAPFGPDPGLDPGLDFAGLNPLDALWAQMNGEPDLDPDLGFGWADPMEAMWEQMDGAGVPFGLNPDLDPMEALLAQMAGMHGLGPGDMYADDEEDEDSSEWETTDGEEESSEEGERTGEDVPAVPTSSGVIITEITDDDTTNDAQRGH